VLQGDIQVVHDIETGYGDPLRMKATPDFSLRFLDGALPGGCSALLCIDVLCCAVFCSA
jgi:hypothetical protein